MDKNKIKLKLCTKKINHKSKIFLDNKRKMFKLNKF